jgi:O-antigen ligase
MSQTLPFAALSILALFLFTSFSFSAGFHIVIIVPSIYFLTKGRKEWSKSSWMLLSFVAVAIISILLNHPPATLKNILKLKYYLLAVLSIYPIKIFLLEKATEKQIKYLYNFALISTTIATTSGLIGLISGFNPLRMKEACHLTRACGMYGMYMTYGYGIALYSLLLVGLAVEKKILHKYFNSRWFYLCLVINIAGLFLSAARGGWIGFFLAIPFFWYLNNKKIFLKVFLMIVIVTGLAYFFIPKVYDVFHSSSRLQSNSIRISQYQAAWIAFKESPFFGIGFKNFEPQSTLIKIRNQIPFESFQGHAHNNFLEVLASTGGIGFLTFFLFLFFWLKEILNSSRSLKILLLPFFVGFIVSGMFQNTFGDGENLFLIMIIYTLSQLGIKKHATNSLL